MVSESAKSTCHRDNGVSQYLVIASLPVALAPRVVILHAEADKGRSILVHQRLGKFEEQRVSRINRHIHLTAQDEILLYILLIDTVDERGGAKGVAGIQRGPQVVIERIADVSFKSG